MCKSDLQKIGLSVFLMPLAAHAEFWLRIFFWIYALIAADSLNHKYNLTAVLTFLSGSVIAVLVVILIYAASALLFIPLSFALGIYAAVSNAGKPGAKFCLIMSLLSFLTAFISAMIFIWITSIPTKP